MENDDKPFVCTAPKCGQRFANNDHLLVHQQKHQLSLNIGLRQGDSLIDQTPTPTRFLPKTTEGGELFEGLPEANPFDQDFKKAAALSTPVSTNPSIPQITINAPEETTTAKSSTKIKTVTATSAASRTEEVKSQLPSTLQNIKILQTDPKIVKAIGAAGSSGITVLVGPRGQKASQNNQTGVVISGQNNNSIPTIIVNPAANGNMPIIGVKGQEANPSVRSAVPHPAIVTPTRTLQNCSSDSAKTTLAKQKLKEILKQNATTSASAKSNMITSTKQHYNGTSAMSTASNSSSSPNSSVNSPDNSELMDDDLDMDSKSVPIKRARRNQDELDPDERRKRFLERNRAAASRCRQKRKVWVQQLEKKADELSATNTRLQSDISLLRTEVAQLKALLLAHKDCPITLQQQKVLLDQSNTAFSQAPENHVIPLTTISQQHIETAEEVASSALTDMANQHQLDIRNNGQLSCVSVISDGNKSTINTSNNVN